MHIPEYSYPLYRPPSEAKSLIFQITEGCSYNKCTFCGMYVDKKFRIKPFEEFKYEVDGIPEYTKKHIKRIFLADGDAVIYPSEGLLKILDYLQEKFPNLESIRSYAGPQALLEKSFYDWRAIFSRKLDMLYFGLESGNNEVLKIMNKGMDADEVKEKIKGLQKIGFDFSVMVILGAGGVKYTSNHAVDSARWISEVNPKYLSLLTLFLRRGKNYFQYIDTPRFRHLIDEAAEFIENIRGEGIIFRSNHVSNLFSLKGTLDRDKDRLLEYLSNVRSHCAGKGVLESYPDFYQENI
ncbi:radical SAM protein [Flexistipes sinusarabici]|uniref:radical SAM protein n=1 Tax=Flexistipes sinusarabici TaxID=2352 RepID=UPI00235360B2|nr:radical SAM protein [Flexistipes sinusarabici]